MNSGDVFARPPRAERGAGRDVPDLPDVPRRVAGDAGPPARRSPRHPPADPRPAPGGARPQADAARRARASRPTCSALFRDLDPLIDASKKGLPALRDTLDGTKPLLGQLARSSAAQPDPRSGSSTYQHQVGDFISNGAGGLAARSHGHRRRASATTCARSARAGAETFGVHRRAWQPTAATPTCRRSAGRPRRAQRRCSRTGDCNNTGGEHAEASAERPRRGAGLHRGQADLLPGQDAGRRSQPARRTARRDAGLVAARYGEPRRCWRRGARRRDAVEQRVGERAVAARSRGRSRSPSGPSAAIQAACAAADRASASAPRAPRSSTGRRAR